MDTPRKTPRTNEAERRCHDEEWPHGLVFKSDMEALEIETQELAEALEHMVSLFGDGDSASIKTVINASAALAAHKAEQPK